MFKIYNKDTNEVEWGKYDTREEAENSVWAALLDTATSGDVVDDDDVANIRARRWNINSYDKYGRYEIFEVCEEA